MMDPEYVAKLEDKCAQAGLLFSVENNALKLFPVLTVEQQTARKTLEDLRIFLGAVERGPFYLATAFVPDLGPLR